jgi:hypothetical protein
MGSFFWVMNKINLFRTPAQYEDAGLDRSKHGGDAYDYGMNQSLATTTSELSPRAGFVTGGHFVQVGTKKDNSITPAV